jgi:hypothetical protein
MMYSIKNKLPPKGVDIIGYDSYSNKHYVFRCNCPNENCLEWRCSLTGFGMLVKIKKWKYNNNN